MHSHQSQRYAPELVEARGVSSARLRAAHLLDRTIFLALLGLLPLVAIPYGTVEPWWEAAFECVVFALGALWITAGLLRGAWRVEEPRLIVPLLLLVGFALVQTLAFAQPTGAGGEAGIETALRGAISADPFETRRFALKLLALVLGGALMLYSMSGPRRLRALVYTVIALGVASAIFGIARQTTQHSALGFVLPYLEKGSGYGQLINRNHFALLMEMALGLVAGLCIGGGVRRERLLIYGAIALPLWTALVLTNSRGGLLAMLCQMLFLALMFSFTPPPRSELPPGIGSSPSRSGRILRSPMMRLVLVGGLLMAVTASVVWVGGDPLVSRLENLPGDMSGGQGMRETRDGAGRMQVWRATWEMIKDQPVAGVGFAGYGVAITKYHDASGEKTPEAAHNDYLELLASGGLIGMALAGWFVLAFVRRAALGAGSSLRCADPFRRAACLGALTGLAGVVVHSMVDFGLHITINALVCAALVAVALAAGRPEERGAGNLRPAA